MTDQTRSALKELQDIDRSIQEIEQRVIELEESILVVEAPAEELARDVESTQQRLQEIRVEERRNELTASDLAERVKKLDERLQGVRNVREEAAVRSEIDMVRQGLAGAEQESLSLLDQIRKFELRLEEQKSALEAARAEVEPRRKELEAERDQAEAELAGVRTRRTAFADGLPAPELRLYDSIRQGGRRLAVAAMTVDGACSSCYGVLPPQAQSEVRTGTSLQRCEFCGVILTAPEPVVEPDTAEVDPAEADAPEADALEADAAEAETSDAETPEAEEQAGDDE